MDKNSKYVHIVASIKKRKKQMVEIKVWEEDFVGMQEV